MFYSGVTIFERSELLICRLHQFGLYGVCQKLCTARFWICLAIKKRRQESGRDGVTQDAAYKKFCWSFSLYRPSRSLEQFQTRGLESTAGQKCASRSTEFASR